jgi:hypothetical protein
LSSVKILRMETAGTIFEALVREGLTRNVSGDGLVQKLIAPVSVDDFLSSTFQKEVRVWRNSQTPFDRIFPFEDYYDLMKACSRDEQIRYFQGRKGTYSSQIDRSFILPVLRSADGNWIEGACRSFLDDGGSFLFFELGDISREVAQLVETFKRFFNCEVYVNAFATPPGIQSVYRHFDPHDVFAFQIRGKKVWRFHKPLKGYSKFVTKQPLVDVRNERTDLEFDCEITLGPGDLMYFPRGAIHEVIADEGDEYSFHFTLTLVYNTWSDLLLNAVHEVSKEWLSLEEFRNYAPLMLSSTEHFRGAEEMVLRSFFNLLKSRIDEKGLQGFSEVIRDSDGYT